MGGTVAVQKNTDGWKPIPDPTVLTTELTLREINNLKELLQAEINNLKLKDERHDLEFSNRAPAIRAEVERLHALFDERFKSIGVQFSERDKRQDQVLEASKLAIEAALLSQKESMAKTEAAFTKQIDQSSVVVNAIAKATDEKIDDLKTRLTLIEGKAKGIGEGWGIIVAAGGLATGILIAVASYLR